MTATFAKPVPGDEPPSAGHFEILSLELVPGGERLSAEVRVWLGAGDPTQVRIEVPLDSYPEREIAAVVLLMKRAHRLSKTLVGRRYQAGEW